MNNDQRHVSFLDDFQARHQAGLVTLVFTDMAGSTKLKSELGDALAGALMQKHHALVRGLLDAFPAAREISTAGDSFLLLFDSPSNAVLFSIKLHSELRALSRAVGHKLRDRVGIHVGEVFVEKSGSDSRVQNLTGIHVDTCARVMGICESERILLTRFAFDNARQVLTGRKIPGLNPLQWLTHGLYELKGVDRPIEVCEVCERGRTVPAPLGDGEKARRFVSAPVIEEGTELPLPTGAPAKTRQRGASLWKEGAIAFAAGLAVAFLSLITPAGRKLAEFSYDAGYWFRPQERPSEAVILSMDAGSHDEKDGRPPHAPWDQTHHARMIERLSAAKPRAIVFDILFESVQPSSTEALISAIAKTSNVFVAAYESETSVQDFDVIKLELPGALEPLLETRTNLAGIVEHGPDGSILREHYRVRGTHGVRPLVELVAEHVKPGSAARNGKRRWMNYYGPPGTIPFKSYIRAFDTNEIPDEFFRGKVVFIGSSAEPIVAPSGGLATNRYARALDQFPTPYTPWTQKNSAGVEINATACLNLLRGEALHQLGPMSELLLFVATAAAAALLAVMLPPAWSLATGLALATLVATLSCALVWRTHAWFSWATISLAQTPGVMLCGIYLRAERLRRQKKSLEKALVTQHTEFMTKASLLSQRSGTDLQATQLDPAAAQPEIPDLELYSSIGKGAYGEVWLARDLTRSYRAVKIVQARTFRSNRPFDREFEGLKRFAPLSRSHPGLIDILHVGQNSDRGFFYYIMEAADDFHSGRQIDPEKYRPKTLSSVLGERPVLDPPEIVALGVKLADALGWIHQHGLIHRDLKPANVLFVSGTPQLADPGLVTEAPESGSVVSMVGTPGYMAPEMAATPSSDLYSLGKLLYQAAMGRPVEAFPELPTQFLASPNHNFYLELNQAILKACALKPQDRHASANEFSAELLAIGTKHGLPSPDKVLISTGTARP